MRLRVAHLHRAGVRAQVQPAALGVLHVDVERVLHRARRVVLRVVQRGEAVPVGLDLGAVGDVEAHRAEDRLDALHRARHRVQAAHAAAGGPASVTSSASALQLRLELGIGQRLAARAAAPLRSRCLVALICAPRAFFCFGRQRAQRLQQLGHAAGLAEEARLGVLQLGRRRRGGEVGFAPRCTRVSRSFIECSRQKRKRPPPR